MPHSLASLISISNLGISGDIGPLSCYNTASGLVVTYPVAPPKEPPSNAQLVIRQRWRQIMHTWSSMSQPDRATWSTAASRGGLKITGANLWLWYWTYLDRATLATIERQTGITLPGI